jgi:DNA-3-methyladenine glycosylase II
MSKVILLSQENEAVQYLCKKDKRLAKVISMVGIITYLPYQDAFHFIVDTIIGQMLSNKVADILSKRFIELCYGNVTPMAVNELCMESIKDIGISMKKIETIKNLAEMVCNQAMVLDRFTECSDDEVIGSLTSIKGIGFWSAKMYLIFVLNRQDVLPYEDGAFLQSYKWLYNTHITKKGNVEKRCRCWKPYSSIGARYLYRALDMGLTKEKFIFEK